MQVLRYNPANVQPVETVYGLDNTVKLTNIREFTSDGLEFTFAHMLSSVQDATINNYTSLFLSDSKRLSDIISIKTPKITYPRYITTTLKPRGSSAYAVVNNNTEVIELSGNIGDIDNRYFFELEILSPIYMAVRHFEGGSLKYLTLDQTTSAELAVKTRAPREDKAAVKDGQLFRYIIDDDNKTLSLFTQILSTKIVNSVYSEELVFPSTVKASGNALTSSLLSLDGREPFTSFNVFDIRFPKQAPSHISADTSWSGYTSAIETNTQHINPLQTFTDIPNNCLITSSTNNLSSTMDINISPLKNQLTIENEQSRSNPFAATLNEHEVSHRQYYNLETGTYQERGQDSITINYGANTKRLYFPPDQLTYFHTAPTLDPYEQVNINSLMLHRSGAIWSDTPIKADKIFKNREDVTQSKDEVGSWLCAWLSGGPNTITPVWVDRYYNPSYQTSTAALTAGIIDIVKFVDKFDAVTDILDTKAVMIYDKLSDLVLEPGSLYAYYHVGRGNSNKVVRSLEPSLIAADLSVYKNYLNNTLLPDTNTIEPTHTMIGGALMTGDKHQADSIDVPKTYTFQGDNYGTIVTKDTRGSFTISFWMYNDDWSVPFANQFLGNYITQGFGMFNESFVTPLISIPNDNEILIFNTDYKLIDRHSINKTITNITRKGSVENYWIVDSNNDIYEYDLKGTIQNKITSSWLTGKTIYDIEVGDRYMYVLIDSWPAGATVSGRYQYVKYNLKNQLTSYEGTLHDANVWNDGPTSYDVGDMTNNQRAQLHTSSQGLCSESGFVVTTPDKALAQGSTVDNFGNPWAIQNNLLYTYDTSISSNIVAVSASAGQKLEAVTCDKSNNIWLLYGGDKVAKLDTDRNILYTTTLSSTPPGSNRYIDFIYQFTPNGYDQSISILCQSLSGARVIELNSSGNYKTEMSVLSTDDKTYTNFGTDWSSKYISFKSSTGFDYLRKNITDTSPSITAKVALSNIYNSSTTTAAYSSYSVSYSLSGMKRGWHHFAVILDAEEGHYSMYVDARKVDHVSLPSAKFTYSRVFTQPMAVGAPPFYTEPILSQFLQQPQYYFANNLKIKQFKMYDRPISYYDMSAHYLTLADIKDTTWDMPCGHRSFNDTVERVFKHKLPGRRSELFNINIKGLDAITDIQLKSDIQSKLEHKLSEISPTYTKLNRIRWGSDYSLALSGLSTPISVNISSPASTTSTTPVNTTSTQSYDY
jgi:hypothetical protein